MTKVSMRASRDFPLGKKGEGAVHIRAGATYEINSTQVKFHEETGRGHPIEKEKKPAAKPASVASKTGTNGQADPDPDASKKE